MRKHNKEEIKKAIAISKQDEKKAVIQAKQQTTNTYERKIEVLTKKYTDKIEVLIIFQLLYSAQYLICFYLFRNWKGRIWDSQKCLMI